MINSNLIKRYYMKKDGYFSKKRKEIRTLLPSTYSRVLEIGCGEAAFREQLDKKHEYWGVDPELSSASVARVRADKFLNSCYQEVERHLPDNYFDLIICNDVIEHMVDYDIFFQSVKKKLTIDGRIIGSVPNVRFLGTIYMLVIKKEWMYEESGILDKTHLRFFTKNSLSRELVRKQFDIECLYGINKINFTGNFLTKKMKIAIMFISVMLLGDDCQYLQIAFRIRNKL